MIISTDSRQASIITDEPTAVFEHATISERAIAVPPSASQVRSVRAAVEILRHGGGLMPRALLGGAFTPSADSRLVIEVVTSGSSVSGTPTCESQLATRLIPGLPDEFASSVFDGLIRRALPGGRVVVDRAGFDAVESSRMAFELAAELLAVVLAAEALRNDVESAARDAVEAWP